MCVCVLRTIGTIARARRALTAHLVTRHRATTIATARPVGPGKIARSELLEIVSSIFSKNII